MTSPAASTANAQKLAVDLPAEIFDVQVNVPLLHQVVVAQLAAARQGTAATRNRSQVRGGGAKPYRQKGTGRARQGSTRSPQFTGGAVVHGPTPRTYGQKTPKKMKAAALRGALSDRARNGRVHVVSGVVTGEVPSTKDAIASLRAVADSRHVLLVAERADTVTWKSVRNVPTVHVIAPDQLNTYDVLVSDDVVFTKAAYDQFLAGPPKGRSAKGAATSGEVQPRGTTSPAVADEVPDVSTHETVGGVPSVAPAEDAADVEDAAEDAATRATPAKPVAQAEASGADATQAPYGPGSHIGLSDGGQPEGFPVKGDAQARTYLLPDAAGYADAADDVWFATAEDAERAGFAPAGRPSNEESSQ